jgi:hypothetical protein
MACDFGCEKLIFMYCISITTDNASVNDILISTISCILLAKYGIPPSPNLQIRCVCHVVNLVVQAILASLGEADDPDKVDYYTLNKEQPLHLNIEADPDQIELDSEQFQDVENEMASDENIALEDEEKLKATKSPLSKVCIQQCDMQCRSTEFCVSYATLQPKLFQHRSDERSSGIVQSQYIRKRTQRTRIDEQPWQLYETSECIGITRMQ